MERKKKINQITLTTKSFNEQMEIILKECKNVTSNSLLFTSDTLKKVK